jgi:phosphomannomutase
LVDLQKKVVKEKADFGLAPDGDGDRLFFIDEKGNVIPPTIITSIIAKDFLKRHQGEKILIDIRYILTPQRIVKENGGITQITKVGHAYITESMNRDGGIFAGESSGHYFFKETGNSESQLPVILIVLKVLTAENKPFSEIVSDYRRSFESGEFNFKVTNAVEIIEALKQKYSDGVLDSIDGIAVNYPSWRFSVRTSNTEPLLRLNVEADDKKTMKEKRDRILNQINSLAVI